MYSSIYKHFQSAATLTAHLFSFLQVYFFSEHSVCYSSLRIIPARLCQCCFGGGPEGRVGGCSFSGSVQPRASLHRLRSTPLIRALDKEPGLDCVHLFAKPPDLRPFHTGRCTLLSCSSAWINPWTVSAGEWNAEGRAPPVGHSPVQTWPGCFQSQGGKRMLHGAALSVQVSISYLCSAQWQNLPIL